MQLNVLPKFNVEIKIYVVGSFSDFNLIQIWEPWKTKCRYRQEFSVWESDFCYQVGRRWAERKTVPPQKAQYLISVLLYW